MLVLDRREQRLSEALQNIHHKLKDLPIGDVLCQREDGTVLWIAERKQAADLASSILSGRLHEQAARLHEADCPQLFWIVEGSLRSRRLPHEQLLRECVDMMLRPKSLLIRTDDILETAATVKLLAKNCTPTIPSGAAPPTMLTKRKRDADKELIFLRQLMCIPTISERVARALVNYFGSLPELQEALAENSQPPVIQIDKQSKIGSKRWETLREALCFVDQRKQADALPDAGGYERDKCNHVLSKRVPMHTRDNGEFDWHCSLCGVDL